MSYQETGGSVWSIGRSEYGRLGLGEEGARDAKVAEQVDQLEGPGVLGDVTYCTVHMRCYTVFSRLPSWRVVLRWRAAPLSATPSLGPASSTGGLGSVSVHMLYIRFLRQS